jgi:hypothetical protein
LKTERAGFVTVNAAMGVSSLKGWHMVQVNDASQLAVCFIPATSLVTVNSPSMVKHCISYLELFGFIFFKAEYLGLFGFGFH